MNLYVGNLNYKVKEADLREVMEEFGVVDSVRIITDRETRRSKGFAFIEMPEADAARNAIKKLNGAEYAGRPMVVKEALPKN
ncbi:MAG: RNA-binding protein [Prevotellaceae bacterium]|jgi:RNA recognition motif-containing protein|nr:RNA-binding protein [Prevotellaceae bacterium]